MSTGSVEGVTRPPYTLRPISPVPGMGPSTMPNAKGVVFVVDDDVSVRESLELLLENAGW